MNLQFNWKTLELLKKNQHIVVYQNKFITQMSNTDSKIIHSESGLKSMQN